ncbi:hypothetical protein SanaruYs_19000 [Chryseotalea sanaruensis]|uniref:Uncharacterized protein n=1 Tax=Chryseotalea sanaruensis TaxID=2482724 RepID=A0A401U9X0_9BACT|nr:hypothetical protein [Chryseotalea sanaruensis]GCC51672.1 hypothetical protein SanaruYs_19000 [Chryseotalea sanaruensis]
MKKLIALSLLLMAFVSVESLAQDKKPASPKETAEGTLLMVLKLQLYTTAPQLKAGK